MLTMLTIVVSLSLFLRHKVQMERSQFVCDIVPPNSKRNASISTNKQQHQIFSIAPCWKPVLQMSKVLQHTTLFNGT